MIHQLVIRQLSDWMSTLRTKAPIFECVQLNALAFHFWQVPLHTDSHLGFSRWLPCVIFLLQSGYFDVLIYIFKVKEFYYAIYLSASTKGKDQYKKLMEGLGPLQKGFTFSEIKMQGPSYFCPLERGSFRVRNVDIYKLSMIIIGFYPGGVGRRCLTPESVSETLEEHASRPSYTTCFSLFLKRLNNVLLEHQSFLKRLSFSRRATVLDTMNHYLSCISYSSRIVFAGCSFLFFFHR